jgi:brefeldin A-resistance guanine nucleotide exchange factor 1
MSDRLEEGSSPWPASAPSAEALNERKDRKGVLIQGASMFNAKPKNGLAFLESEGIITYQKEGLEKDEAEQKRAVALAAFLRSSSRLDKKEIGDYISRPDQLPLLKAFIQTFDFGGVSARVCHGAIR